MNSSFPNFCPCFQLRTNQRKLNMVPKPIRYPPPTSPCQQPAIRADLKPSLFQYKAFPLPCLLLNICQMPVVVADSVAMQALNIFCSHLGGLYFHTFKHIQLYVVEFQRRIWSKSLSKQCLL